VPAIPKWQGGNGWKDATDDPALIAEWARRFPDGNIAVATGKMSGITVIDVDPRNGGFATLARLARDGLVFPPCPEAKTGNGGRHLIGAYRPDIAASKNKPGTGIDIKSDGGYIVAAPSWIGKSEQGEGGRYEWLKMPTNVPPALPYWFIERMRPKPRPQFEPRITHEMAERSLEGLCAKLAREPQSNRNHLLNWCAYTAGGLVRHRARLEVALSRRV
jgi:putative DNA primase/helicase